MLSHQYAARFEPDEWESLNAAKLGGERSINAKIRLLVRAGLRVEAARPAMERAVASCETCSHLPREAEIRCEACRALLEVLGDAST